MELSLGLIVVLFLIFFPGLIYRRLYFYGEFSKEFKSDFNLFSLLAISTIPGIINLIIIYVLYDNFFESIDLGEIIDVFKNINNESYRFKESNSTPIKELINSKASPFIGFLYVSSFLLGSVSGRIVRLSRLDTKYKIIRFKNYWFYIFNGQHTNFKKMKHLKLENRKHLFTKADILIDHNNKTELYSGIVVDYQLWENSSNKLEKIMLQNAKRYKKKCDVTATIDIPGNLFIVDCSKMKNINLTYAYEEVRNFLDSKLPNIIDIIFGLFILLLIPTFIFKVNFINIKIYELYFSYSWYKKICAFLLVIQVLSILKPFEKINDEYKYITLKVIIARCLWIILFLFLMYLL